MGDEGRRLSEGGRGRGGREGEDDLVEVGVELDTRREGVNGWEKVGEGEGGRGLGR